MDIIRQVTLEYPVETFLFGANWLLEVATRAVSTSSYAGMLVSLTLIFCLFGTISSATLCREMTFAPTCKLQADYNNY